MISKKTIKQIKNIVFKFLDPQEDKVFIFGSQASKKGRRYSDIDIGIESSKKISLLTMFAIRSQFEDSDIPYTVDIVDFRSVSSLFKKLAERKIIQLN